MRPFGRLSYITFLGAILLANATYATDTPEQLEYINKFVTLGYEATKMARDGNFAAAEDILKPLTDANDENAFRSLAQMYLDYGKGNRAIQCKSVHWQTKAARTGNIESIQDVASNYFTGRCVGRDYDMVYLWGRLAQQKYKNPELEGELFIINTMVDSAAREHPLRVPFLEARLMFQSLHSMPEPRVALRTE